jgi:Concanavalin A-like lectin/glucanases superfamily
MKHSIRLALLLMLTVATVASAQLYPLFGPATGILKGTVSSPQTSAAASSDVAALWSGTCNSSSFLRGDGVCAAPSGGSGTVTSITAGTGLTGGTITTSGTIALSSPVSATNGGTGEAGTVSGVMKGNATSAVTAAASSDVIALWTGTCNSTTFLRADGSCQPASGGGSGTVTSVALTMPGGFSVSGSPITNAGTFAVSTSLSGVIKGTGSAFTTAAASDVYALWSGTCNSTTFLRGDGTCAAAGGGSTPVPATISGLLLWYKADPIDSPASTSIPALPNWAPNYIGVGVAVGANPFTVSTSQLNSLNTITLAANTQMELLIYSASNTQRGPLLHNSTMFAVVNPSTLSGGSGIGSDIMSGSSNPALEVRVSTAGILSLQAQGVATIATSTTAVATVGTWTQFNYSYNDSTGAYVFRSSQAANGSGTSAGHTISQPQTSLLWFGGAGGFNLDWIGSVAEIIIYNRVLTPTEVTTVETYLNTKWGV